MDGNTSSNALNGGWGLGNVQEACSVPLFPGSSIFVEARENIKELEPGDEAIIIIVMYIRKMWQFGRNFLLRSCTEPPNLNPLTFLQ